MTPGFQLEKTAPGAFLVQGFAAGVVSVFITTLVFVACDTEASRGGWVLILPCSLFLGGCLGTALSILPWYLSGDDGYEMYGWQRVWTALAELIVYAFLLSFALGPAVLNSYWYWLGVLLLGISTGIFVGSKIRPWLLFTSGSIAVPERKLVWRLSTGTSAPLPQVITLPRFNLSHRVTIRSLRVLFCSLPLRFASILVLTIWLQSVACFWRESLSPLTQFAVWGWLPVIYLSLSVYVTLRSPRKFVLLLIGIVSNTATAVIAVSGFNNPFGPGDAPFPRGGAWPLVLSILSSVFLLFWSLFLAARLTVKVFSTESITTLPPNIPEFNREAMCLGSRFVDWEAGVQRV